MTGATRMCERCGQRFKRAEMCWIYWRGVPWRLACCWCVDPLQAELDKGMRPVSD